MYIFLKKIIKGLLNFYPLSIKKKRFKKPPLFNIQKYLPSLGYLESMKQKDFSFSFVICQYN